jgi:hypothetical protein
MLFLQRDAALTSQATWCVTRALSSPQFPHCGYDCRVYIDVAVLILLIGRAVPRQSKAAGSGAC